MAIKNYVGATFMLTLLSLSNHTLAAVNCVYASYGVVDGSDLMNEHVVSDEGLCFLSPDSLEATFYSLSFCTEEPKPDNYQQICQRVMHFPTGKVVPIEIGKSTTMFDDGISIPEGTYPYAAMMLDNKPRIKAKVTFDETFTGANSTSGTTCWTNGSDAKDSRYAYGTNNKQFTVNCGTAAQAQPQWSIREYKALKNPLNSYKFDNKAPYLDLGKAKSAYIMADENTIATVTPDSNDPWDQNLVQSNGTMILSVQKLAQPLAITPNTNNIDLGFSLTNNFWIEITSDSSSNPHNNTTMGCTPVAGSIGCATSFQIRQLTFFATSN